MTCGKGKKTSASRVIDGQGDHWLRGCIAGQLPDRAKDWSDQAVRRRNSTDWLLYHNQTVKEQ